MMGIKLRKADKKDLPQVLSLIKELAAYEKAADAVTVTLEELEQDGFGENPLFEIILAEKEESGIIGMSFFYLAYSTWKGKCLYLEDIVVKENYRGLGIGKLLFDATISRAKELNAARLMWQVLDWNEPAINFYKKYKAEISSEWLNGRLTREEMRNL